MAALKRAALKRAALKRRRTEMAALKLAKSNEIYDVKPWDDTIDIKDIEEKVRFIKCDGLVWGASKILPVAYAFRNSRTTLTFSTTSLKRDLHRTILILWNCGY
uniref:Translation elongation factor EF1B beta/delta subunit guanine nucleotide exchange domain-containing protein n=1 Tax=Globodera rostochiensis TaxID=31243 RepID=A0A914HJ56_GLORO